jgi:iron complex outermembrane receptor protein
VNYYKSVRAALCLVLSAGLSLQVMAATPAATDDDYDSLEVVVVTGSHIATTVADATSTIQVLKREDIDREGVTSVAELLNSLAQAGGNSTLSDITGENSFAPGSSSVGLRNLGEQSTLVLVNGRRVAPNALADYNLVFTNLDALPLDAIDHVEIDFDGASAIYGSDAVAGVINIITRKDFEGAEVSVNRQATLLGDNFGTNTAAVTLGKGNLASDGYNVMLNVDYFDRSSAMWTDYLGEVNHNLTKVSPAFGSPSTYTPYGNFIDTTTGDVQAGADCPTADTINGLCRYNRYDRFQAVPESKRLQGYLSADLRINDAVTAFGEASYSSDITNYIEPFLTYGASENQVLLRNGTNFYYMELGPNNTLDPFAGAGDDAEFRYRFTDAPYEDQANNSQFRVLGGLKGVLGTNTTWESALGIMGSREVSVEQGEAYSASGFTKEIGCYLITCATIDPFAPDNGTVSTDPNFFQQPGGYKLGGGNSASVLDTLFPAYGFTGEYTQAFWDGNINTKFGQLPGGPMQFTAGGELRHEKYSIDPSANLSAGDIVGFGVSSVDSERTFGALYAELEAPLTKSLTADAALRMDDYAGIGAHVSPKLGLNWKITDWVRVRGNWSTGFRAPNLVESANAVKVSYAPGTADPARCPSALALVNALYTTYFANPNAADAASILARADEVYNNECNNSLNTTTNGNPDLKPETSNTYTFSIILEPVRGFAITTEYWNIQRHNTISELSGSQLVNLALAGSPLPPGSTVSRNPYNPASDPSFTANDTELGGINDFTTFGVPALGQLTGTTTEFANLYSQKTSGIDLQLHARVPVTFATLDVNWNSSYLLDYHDASITNYSENLAGQYAFPRINSNLTIALGRGAFDNGIRINYTGAQLLQDGSVDTSWTLSGCTTQGLTASECHIAGDLTTDYFLSYKPISGLTVALNVINIFAQKAPPDYKGFGGTAGIIPPASALQDVEGRFVKLGFSYRVK